MRSMSIYFQELVSKYNGTLKIIYNLISNFAKTFYCIMLNPGRIPIGWERKKAQVSLELNEIKVVYNYLLIIYILLTYANKLPYHQFCEIRT
jgi:hypothetical protein